MTALKIWQLKLKSMVILFHIWCDEQQKVAKAYGAACTPDFFLFDADKKLVYRGQFDSARPGNNEAITGADLSAAIEQLIAGKPVSMEQRPSMGCNIKWKPGNEPAYFGSVK